MLSGKDVVSEQKGKMEAIKTGNFLPTKFFKTLG